MLCEVEKGGLLRLSPFHLPHELVLFVAFKLFNRLLRSAITKNVRSLNDMHQSLPLLGFIDVLLWRWLKSFVVVPIPFTTILESPCYGISFLVSPVTILFGSVCGSVTAVLNIFSLCVCCPQVIISFVCITTAGRTGNASLKMGDDCF